MPICLECGQRKKSLTYTHLKSCCGLTTKQYKQKHPNAEFVDEAVRLASARYGKENGNYKGENCKKIYCPSCSNQMSGNGAVCRKCAEKQGKFSHPHTKEAKLKMSMAQRSRDPSTRYKIPPTKEIIAKREATKRKTWANMDPDEKYRKLKNFILAGKRTSGTSIELKIKKYLDDLGLREGCDYICNVDIGIYNVDFLIADRYIIEAYGDYWHKNPVIFSEGEDKRNKDKVKKEWLESNGYEFCYFWESDINKDMGKIDKGIKNLFGYYYALFDWESCR